MGAVVAAVLLASGCAKQMGEESAPPPAKRTVATVVAAALPRLPHGKVLTVVPAVKVADNRITVGTKVVDVSPLRADSAVSTRGGVYFLNAGELWFLSADGAGSTGFTGLTRLVVSGNGRFLGLVDRNHGPAVRGGAPVAAVVVYDTETGRVKLRSYAGMGRASAKLSTAYAATPPVATGFDGSALVAITPSGTWRYPLDGADPTRVS